MAGPAFPNVPKADGVPPVNRGADNPGTDTTDRLGSDGITVAGTGLNQWGIYGDDGKKALDPDTIVAVGYDAEHRIADFPIEEGAFESYDKVALPFDVAVRMTKGGSFEDRRAFLSAIDELRGDTKIYSVTTPERTYLSVNFSRVSVDRSREQGAGLITADLHLREIRQTVTAAFSKSKDPASADAANNGPTQGKPATTSTAAVK